MKYDKVTIVGVALCVILLFLWGPLVRSLGLQRTAPPPAVPEAPAPEAAQAEPPQPAPPESPSPSEPFERGVWAPTALPPHPLVAEGAFTAEADPGGNGITRVTLHQYARDVVRDPAAREPVTLGRPEYPFLALDVRAAGLRLGPATVLEAGPGALEIRRAAESGLVLTERWEISPTDPYQLRYSARFVNPGPEPIRLPGLALESGAMPPNVSSQATASRSVLSTVTVAFADQQRPRSFTSKQLAKLLRRGRSADLERRPAKWVAVQSQYFLLAVIAGTMADGDLFAGSQADLRQVTVTTAAGAERTQLWCQARALLDTLSVPAGGETVFRATGLAAPKDYTLLRQVGGGIAAVVGMDSFLFWNPAWMGVLTRWLLDVLIGLHRLFNVPWGYGMAIIVITIAVKVLFWPLTHYSTISMRRMQALQPQLKELREKYKDDPQKLYRKQAELFKENHVNQFGGCLPILLQLPVFFALFITFRGAIELRHASFLWAADLSQPDDVFGLPIRPLALLMGATMLLQQRLTPSTGDPQQQRMMNMMSIFFIFLFYGMPSGLTLYWTVSQILSIVQMLVTNALHRRSMQAPAAAAKAVP